MMVGPKRFVANVLFPEPAGPHSTRSVLGGTLTRIGIPVSPLLRCIPSSGIMAVHTYTCNTCNVCLVDIDTLTNVFYYIHGLLSVGECIHKQTTNVHADIFLILPTRDKIRNDTQDQV